MDETRFRLKKDGVITVEVSSYDRTEAISEIRHYYGLYVSEGYSILVQERIYKGPDTGTWKWVSVNIEDLK